MRVYAREMARAEGQRDQLRALVEGVVAPMPDTVPTLAEAA
jgi:hypothetical protein